ncbi:uncharacterized protein LOC114932956 isoform X1 [Nylanderia fulva]|uniref:uncharacterized protein LOC114932956 isoform X1 n=2 Tax=Nylanderia fulva TaxID=613905 RepID=UPI0010FAE068|nr:uncharacterized protein LOC114932956 isoform X1 [Nylanderia fulva]
MKHFIKEHPIKFLLHLISKKLLDNLQIFKIFNDAKDIAKPGGSNQQPRQNINQSSFKITSPRLSDISEFKSSDNDIENVSTSAISSFEQPTHCQILKLEEMLPDIPEIKNSDNNTEDVGTSTISSYQQLTQELNNYEEMLSDISEFKSSDNDIENVGTSAISSYELPTHCQILKLEEMLPDIPEIRSFDNDIENVGTSAISSYDQPTPNIDQSSQ